MDGPLRHDLVNDGDRRVNALFPIVLKTEIAVGGGRIFPGNHENGEAVSNQEAHQRIVRRKIENIILHDPGRHDQYGLRPHRRCGRRILNELDQIVAIDDLARRHRNILADGKLLIMSGTALEQALPVLHPVVQAIDEIASASLHNLAQHFRVGAGKVRRSDRVETLTCHEIGDRSVGMRQAAERWIVAECHQSSFSKKAWASRLKGGNSQSRPAKRRSAAGGLITDHGWNVACLGTMAFMNCMPC